MDKQCPSNVYSPWQLPVQDGADSHLFRYKLITTTWYGLSFLMGTTVPFTTTSLYHPTPFMSYTHGCLSLGGNFCPFCDSLVHTHAHTLSLSLSIAKFKFLKTSLRNMSYRFINKSPSEPPMVPHHQTCFQKRPPIIVHGWLRSLSTRMEFAGQRRGGQVC